MYRLTTTNDGSVIAPDDIGTASPDVVDAFVARMEALEVQARRPPRRSVAATRGPRRSTADDGRPAAKVHLVLYTSAASEKSQRALKAVRAVLAEYERSQIKFTVCDLGTATPAEAEGIIFTPTLVKRWPGPPTWIIGNLDHRDLLIDLLDVSGVDRRKA